MFVFQWTDERVERLKALWESGLSASQIAAELGGITRNSVIGKVHRLGLSKRSSGKTVASTKRSSHTTTGPRPKIKRARVGFGSISPFVARADAQVNDSEVDPELTDNVVPLHQRLSLFELTDVTCKWPIGDPQKAGFHFCGGPALSADPYCAHHCRIAYQPLQDRVRHRRRRRWHS